MKRQPLISVVLPTYNVAQYLQQCLESVAAQTYRNMEVIIIIDGATDGSYGIAQEFCKRDNRFTAYWQENAGSGPARNTGLAHCRGELVMFVDPDDWIGPELLEKLYDAQCEGDYDLVASKRSIALCDKNGKVVSITTKHYEDETIVSAPTQKLYKTSLIRQNGITFPALRRSQDIVFNYRYYNHIQSLRLIQYSGYYYRDSIEQNIRKSPADYYKTILLLYEDYQSLYLSWGLPFPEEEMCGWLFRVRIYANLQKLVGQGASVRHIVDEQSIRSIVEKARPDAFYLKVARKLILKRSYRTLSVFLKMILLIKRNHIIKK